MKQVVRTVWLWALVGGLVPAVAVPAPARATAERVRLAGDGEAPGRLRLPD